MSVGVQAKQFVHYLGTLCQKTGSFLTMCTVGEKSSPPYLRMGKSRDTADQGQRKGERPITRGGELFDRHEGCLYLGQSLSEACSGGERRSEPEPKPPKLALGVKN